MPAVDRSVRLSDLQFDVNMVLAKLMRNGFDKGSMRGELGGILLDAKGGCTSWRCVRWKCDERAVSLVHEAYVRFVLDDLLKAGSERTDSHTERLDVGDELVVDIPELERDARSDSHKVWTACTAAEATHTLHTRVCTSDSLYGLKVRWMIVGKGTATLDVDLEV